MARTIDVRCPVCKDWRQISSEVLGFPCVCSNCNQTVTMVPRSGQARKFRVMLKALIVVGGACLFFCLYRARVDHLTSVMAPRELSGWGQAGK